LDKKDFKITAVAHSMGAGSIFAYLVKSKLSNESHYIDKSILLGFFLILILKVFIKFNFSKVFIKF
jgi:hypothetical protein